MTSGVLCLDVLSESAERSLDARAACERLVADQYDRIHRLAWTLTGAAEDARDLTQETFLAAVQAMHRFRGEAQVSTWLISILRNQFTLYLRRRRRWRFAPLDAAADRAAAPAPEPPEVMALKHVRSLPEELQLPVVLFYVDEMRYQDIAAALGCPIGTVRSRLFEARERLRRLVKGAEHDL